MKMNVKSKKTNKKMMILSCIGIILVVLGHTNNQIQCFSNIYRINAVGVRKA